MDTLPTAGPEPAPGPVADGTDPDQLLARLERIARAERWAEINFETERESFVLAVTLRSCLAHEWEAAAGGIITGIEVPDDAVPTAEEARSIIAVENAEQDRIGKARHLEAAERKQRELDANARIWPNSHWAVEARRHRAYVKDFRHRRLWRRHQAPNDATSSGARTHSRPRGAGRPRARRVRTTGGSDPGGDGPGDGEPPAGLAGPAESLRRDRLYAVAAPAPSGRAIVYVRGRVYVCSHAEVCGGAVTFTGRLRVRHAGGERLYPPRSFTYSVHKVERIEWLADHLAVAA